MTLVTGVCDCEKAQFKIDALIRNTYEVFYSY